MVTWSKSGHLEQKGGHLEQKGGHLVQPVAQRQEMVSGTLALLNDLSEAASHVGRASAPKGDEVL